MAVQLFVYGTLKEGFPNFHLNIGRRVPGIYRTQAPHRLMVVRLPHEERAPWLMPAGPEDGLRVHGQLFEIDDALLADLDRFEEVHRPTGYQRVPLLLERLGDDGAPQATLTAFSYLKRPDQLVNCLAVEGPFADYTLALAEGYWIRPA